MHAGVDGHSRAARTKSIKNRQKSRSGLQGVLLGVPSAPGSANWHQNDDPRPQKWSPQASKIPGLSFQLTSSHRSGNQQWGGRRQGAQALRIRRARPWPAVGVGTKPPRKVPTFPEGNPGVCASAAGPLQCVQKSGFLGHAQKILKMSQNCLPGGAQMEPEILKISKKCIPGAS